MTYQLLQGNCIAVLRSLPDGIARTCVTSPPYYHLRDYQTARWEGGNDPACDHTYFKGGHGEASKLQTSSKGTQLYQYAGVCKRCGAVRIDEQIGLEKTPEAYVDNLVAVFREVWRVLANDGTLWLNLGDSYNGSGGAGGWNKDRNGAKKGARVAGLKPKDLIGIPWMAAFALRADGWYLRRDIIWHKPNPTAESAKDRPTGAHEYIFLLSKSHKYYYDWEAIAEASVTSDGRPAGLRSHGNKNGQPDKPPDRKEDTWNTDIRNKRSVWTVAAGRSGDEHYASYPVDLIEPCILAGSVIGDTVLDPFTGTSTTGAAALRHGRNYIGIDLNPSYIEISKRRLMAATPIPEAKVTKGIVQLGFGQILNGD